MEPFITIKTGQYREAEVPGKKEIHMKRILQFSICIVLLTSIVNAQELKEVVQPLTSKAANGYVYDIRKDEAGVSFVTYKIKGAKKSEEVFYEEYSFDSNLKFLGSKDVQEKKEQKEDIQRTYYSAYVGGTTSFDVLSMKLKLNKVVQLLTWNHEKQKYIAKKTISRENVKPRNDAGRVYNGYASYSSDIETESDVFTIAKVESKDKNQADKFLILMFNDQLEIKEKPIEMSGNYSLVYCDHMKSNHVIAIFAPEKGNGDPSNYLFFEFDIQGNILNKIPFKSPASALLLTAAYENNGSIYLFGTSAKSTESFEKVFHEYAPIFNPGYTEGGDNLVDFKWRKSLEERMENFHLLKFTGNQMVFSSTTPVDEFKSKFKTAPGDKGASPYKGKRFMIENFFVTPSEDYLLAGQLTSTVNLGTGNKVDSYEDIVCFQFDGKGALKAQYGLGKINNDKKSEIFQMFQNLYLSPDGKSIYWEILEVKGTKGYEDFLSAYYGVPSFYPLYYPRVGKIDLGSTSLTAFKSMGEGKYYLKRAFTSTFDPKEGTVTYFGHDEDYKKLWIGKLMIQ